MKRGLFLFILISLILTAIYAGDAWKEDAVLGDGYFRSGDYDAAWLFYQRALSKRCDDGLVLFRAAESFRLQQLPDNPKESNPEFESSLYAVARYFLESQYPDSPAFVKSGKYIREGTVVDRRFLRKTFGVIGGKAPKRVSTARHFFRLEPGSVGGFFASRFKDIETFFSIVKTGEFKEAFSWVKANLWSFLFSLLIINSLTGIILPVVMAVTVAREGRKSYVTAYAFLLHWGFLGIHRFYLGRYASGVLWLFTGGLLGIGVFFDIFLTGAYIRFWNEDHRDERPVNRPRYTGRTRPATVKKNKPPRFSGSVKKTKTKKAPKKKKEPVVSLKKPPERDSDEEFSFGENIEEAGDEAVSSMPESDDDFGNLPDLSFDDAPEDISLSPATPENSGDDFSDEDFDIKAFD